MKRVGERGEGRFEPITWDEALTMLAGELKRVRDTCGNQSILLTTGSGNWAALHGGMSATARLLSMFGGLHHRLR